MYPLWQILGTLVENATWPWNIHFAFCGVSFEKFQIWA